jgi:hypothetical protein
MDKSSTFDYDFESTNSGEYKGKNCNAIRQIEINNGEIYDKTDAIKCGISKYNDTTGDVEGRKKFYKTILVDYCNKNSNTACPEPDEFGLVNNAEKICKDLEVCDYGMKIGDIMTVATEFLGIFNTILSPINLESTLETLKYKKNDRLKKFKKDKKNEKEKVIKDNREKLNEISKETGISIDELLEGRGSKAAKKLLEKAGIKTDKPDIIDAATVSEAETPEETKKKAEEAARAVGAAKEAEENKKAIEYAKKKSEESKTYYAKREADKKRELDAKKTVEAEEAKGKGKGKGKAGGGRSSKRGRGRSFVRGRSSRRGRSNKLSFFLP